MSVESEVATIFISPFSPLKVASSKLAAATTSIGARGRTLSVPSHRRRSRTSFWIRF
ncbi:hypothetical protein MANES_16G094202v8 [Manihot esculenta]|uniref:Uncharacterized protein n=1 Tax=Manihot esculenta TaxID=3983 RepID=A0ACB7G7P3_MANES|nr:hypothetical protein MANES_16G094202v8 [Manihot esculenta]